jgi:site-specific DNA recombinase
MPLRFAGYYRCSTDKQDDSLDTQETLCREYAEQNDYTITRRYADPSISGSVPLEKRPGGAELLADVKSKHRPFDAILVLRTDRMFRNPLDEYTMLAYFAKHNCPLVSVKDPIDTTTPGGALFHGIMMHLREFERRQSGQRIKEHNISMVLKHKWPGGFTPFGLTYDIDAKHVIPSDRADDALYLFKTWIEANGNSHLCARILNAQGIPAQKGGTWDPATISNTVRQAGYRQQMKYNDYLVDAPELIDRIIPAEIITQVDAILQTRKTAPPRSMVAPGAYSGLITCWRCGARMRHFPMPNKYTGEKSHSYRCGASTRGICDSRIIGAGYIDTLVGDGFQYLADHIDGFNDRIIIPQEIEIKKPTGRRDRERIENRRTAILRQHELQIINDAQLIERIAEIDKLIRELEEPKPKPIYRGEEARDLALEVSRLWGGASNEDKRRLLMLLNMKVAVDGVRPLGVEMTIPGLARVEVKRYIRHTKGTDYVLEWLTE